MQTVRQTRKRPQGWRVLAGGRDDAAVPPPLPASSHDRGCIESVNVHLTAARGLLAKGHRYHAGGQVSLAWAAARQIHSRPLRESYMAVCRAVDVLGMNSDVEAASE